MVTSRSLVGGEGGEGRRGGGGGGAPTTSKLERSKIKSGISRKGGAGACPRMLFFLWPALAAIFFPGDVPVFFACIPMTFLHFSMFSNAFRAYQLENSHFRRFESPYLNICEIFS